MQRTMQAWQLAVEGPCCLTMTQPLILSQSAPATSARVSRWASMLNLPASMRILLPRCSMSKQTTSLRKIELRADTWLSIANCKTCVTCLTCDTCDMLRAFRYESWTRDLMLNGCRFKNLDGDNYVTTVLARVCNSPVITECVVHLDLDQCNIDLVWLYRRYIFNLRDVSTIKLQCLQILGTCESCKIWLSWRYLAASNEHLFAHSVKHYS